MENEVKELWEIMKRIKVTEEKIKKRVVKRDKFEEEIKEVMEEYYIDRIQLKGGYIDKKVFKSKGGITRGILNKNLSKEIVDKLYGDRSYKEKETLKYSELKSDK